MLWAALTGVLFAWAGTRIWSKDLPDRALDRMIGAAALGMAAGRLLEMLSTGTNPITDPGAILIVRGGVHTVTASLVAAAFYVWSVKGRAIALDASAAPVTLGVAGWHAGCLWTGSCLGAASELPWAWSLPNSDVTRHPVELYAAIALVAGAVLISRLPPRPLLKTGVAVIIISGVRFATEPLRLGIGGDLRWWYAFGVLVGVATILSSSRLVRVSAPT